ncbi:MAG TPA: MarR family transcriptional regulator [Gaiella sp.]|nr:MarR family transcriptional regulator [Gaiella sp.]
MSERPAGAAVHLPRPVDRSDLGFLLAKATQRWNELLAERFAAAGYPEVRPAYGSVLVPLYEEDGLRMGELALRARLSKQTMTELVRRLERDGLVERRGDPRDARASQIFLTQHGRAFEPVVVEALTELDRLVTSLVGSEQRDELRSMLQELLELGSR